MPTLANNKKIYYNYQIIQTFEAGIALSGPEVKSVRAGQINLSGGYISCDPAGSLWLKNVHIAPYPPAFTNQQNYNPLQNRRLLLHKKEISSLTGKISITGHTLVPLKVYTKNRLIKIEIGLAKGKKKWDKRETIKKRESERKIQQILKRNHSN